MKQPKEEWLIRAIIIIPLIFVLIFWNQFPETVPTHFGWEGKPDDYSDKLSGLLLLPGINAALYVFLAYVPSKFNVALAGNKLMVVRLVIHAFMSLLSAAVIFYSLGFLSRLDLLIQYGITLLFLVLGNYMNSVKPNYFFGIRTPWTLSSEKVWTKTHRLGARIWVWASLAMLIIIPLLNEKLRPLFFLYYMIGIAAIPIVYSYVVFRAQKSSES